MNDEKSDNVDLLGIKPIANSINTVVETASEFLNIICRPAAEEFGLLLQDSIRYWRIKNLSNIAIKHRFSSAVYIPQVNYHFSIKTYRPVTFFRKYSYRICSVYGT